MYGLLLENLAEYIKQVYGEDKWEEIRRAAAVEQPSFSVHQVYPETLIPRLAKKAMQILGVSEREFFDQMGVHFVGFVSQYGYDRVLSVLGRHMRDFLNGLDNLHEYLKFSYPRMRAPSFICENETRQGLTLHYRSKRRGFVYYTMGQIREVARHFYHKEMRIELVREEILFDTVHVTFQLTFDNRAFTLASLTMTREEKHLPISASDMIVRSIGNSLMVILPDLVSKKITNWFDLVRPLIAFKFQTILNRTNNIFELVTVEPVLTERPSDRKRNCLILSDESDDGPSEKHLRLKGQMIYMDNWRMMMYLGTPVMPDLHSLVTTGLYINDLSMHDFSRDLMLAGTQQSVELKLALDQEQSKSKKLEESMRKLDEEMKRTDELLYQMIPKQVADRLRAGENPIDTCQIFDSVSILFSDVVSFTEICSRIAPMEVVSMLNAMYSIFDTLTERNRVYKVETIGDAYMVVSGAPEAEVNHAEKVCDMALDMVDAITDLKDPSTGSHLQIRVGVHSGAVVAGIVGLKMPRYCLFGDTVNTASRMESTSEAMKVHISQATKDLISNAYHVEERGEVQLKGKGATKTYWLTKRECRTPLSRVISRSNIEPECEWEKSADMRGSLMGLVPMEDDRVQMRPRGSTLALGCIGQERARPRISSLGFVGSGEDRLHRPRGSITPAEERRSYRSGTPGDDRRIYSPVTFQDVARRSICSSPVRNTAPIFHSKGARSNSLGTGLLPCVAFVLKDADDLEETNQLSIQEHSHSSLLTLELAEALKAADSATEGNRKDSDEQTNKTNVVLAGSSRSYPNDKLTEGKSDLLLECSPTSPSKEDKYGSSRTSSPDIGQVSVTCQTVELTDISRQIEHVKSQCCLSDRQTFSDSAASRDLPSYSKSSPSLITEQDRCKTNDGHIEKYLRQRRDSKELVKLSLPVTGRKCSVRGKGASSPTEASCHKKKTSECSTHGTKPKTHGNTCALF